MNLNDAFSIVIKYLIEQARNQEFIEKMTVILNGIEGKSYIDQEVNPRHVSIILFGSNIFPYKDSDYVDMALLIKG